MTDRLNIWAFIYSVLTLQVLPMLNCSVSALLSVKPLQVTPESLNRTSLLVTFFHLAIWEIQKIYQTVSISFSLNTK